MYILLTEKLFLYKSSDFHNSKKVIHKYMYIYKKDNIALITDHLICLCFNEKSMRIYYNFYIICYQLRQKCIRQKRFQDKRHEFVPFKLDLHNKLLIYSQSVENNKVMVQNKLHGCRSKGRER